MALSSVAAVCCVAALLWTCWMKLGSLLFMCCNSKHCLEDSIRVSAGLLDFVFVTCHWLLCRIGAISQSSWATMCRAVAYEPPSEEVTEALIVLARYVTTSEHPGSKEHPFRPAQVCRLLGVFIISHGCNAAPMPHDHCW